MTDRRSFITGLALAPVVIATPAAAATPDYMSRLHAIDLWTVKLDNSDAPEAEWERWSDESARLWKEIAALPCTPENVKIKARCVHSICCGDLTDIINGDTTAQRLARQILAIMGAGA